MPKQATSTAVAVVDPQSWALTSKTPDKITKALDGLKGLSGFNPYDLPRIKIPSSGGKFWEVNTANGIEALKTFDAVILYSHAARQNWEQPYGQGPVGPPDCSSDDGITGYGKPGGSCLRCHLAKFGGTCAPAVAIYLLLPHMVLPTLFLAPRQSIKPLEEYYMKSIAATGDEPHDVITTFGLIQKPMRTGGNEYSVATYSRADDVPPELLTVVEAYREQFITFLIKAQEARREALSDSRGAPDLDAAPSLWGGSDDGVPAGAAPVADDDEDDIVF